jgi:hypothetical protein
LDRALRGSHSNTKDIASDYRTREIRTWSLFGVAKVMDRRSLGPRRCGRMPIYGRSTVALAPSHTSRPPERNTPNTLGDICTGLSSRLAHVRGAGMYELPRRTIVPWFAPAVAARRRQPKERSPAPRSTDTSLASALGVAAVWTPGTRW